MGWRGVLGRQEGAGHVRVSVCQLKPAKSHPSSLRSSRKPVPAKPFVKGNKENSNSSRMPLHVSGHTQLGKGCPVAGSARSVGADEVPL